MASIPDEIIDRVRSEANVVDVIGDYVRLRRTGKNWTGLCPFHDDKKPSFHVEPIKGIFKCFACGEGGNVFTFLMKRNGWSFPETVRNLAGELGIEIPEEREGREDFGERERLVALLRDAARFFHEALFENEGEAALGYFQGRGFDRDTIVRFGLGFAYDSWDRLLKSMTGRGYTAEELERSGLAIRRREREGFYDRFRGRAQFPIFEASGRLVGFGARRLNEDPDQPKYINSPETEIYHKSRVLYGLYQAKEAIRKKGYALFVEGYADVISLHQAGIQTAVATCGTAIADEHTRLVSRFTDKAVLVFDSDSAGERATEKGIETLLAGGLSVLVARLPDGEDPDTFIRKEGAEHFEERIEGALPFIEYLADLYRSRGDFNDPERAAGAIRSLVSIVSIVPDELRRRLHVNRLAAEYRIDETTLHRELARALQDRDRKRGSGRSRKIPQNRPAAPSLPSETTATGNEPPMPEEGSPVGVPGDDAGPPVDESPPTDAALVPVPRPEETSPEVDENANFPPAEFYLAEALAGGDAALLKETFERIDEQEFTHPLLRRFVELILAHYLNHASFSLDELSVEELDEPMQRFVAGLAVKTETISDFWREKDPEYSEPNPWKTARDCLVRMQIDRLRRDEEALLATLRSAESASDNEEELLSELVTIAQKVRELTILLVGD